MVNFAEFTERMEFYRRHPNRPFVVIILHRPGDLYFFSQITKSLPMNYVLWLILFIGDADKDACNFCRDPHENLLNLKFNSEVLIMCCNSNIIEDWWSVTRNGTNKGQLGRWIEERNEIEWFAHKSIHRRRTSLEGRAFRISFVQDSSYIWIKDGHLQGFLADVLRELAKSMNFTISTATVEDTYGILDPGTSIWRGVVGQLQRQATDIGVDGFSRTSARRSVIDFTVPIITVDSRLYIKKPDGTNVQWNAYFQAFTRTLWAVIIAVILIMPVFLTLIKYNRRFNFFPLIVEHYLHVWGIYCQQGLPEFPDGMPLRILYVSIFISALVVSSAYSASLTSFLAVSQLPFNTMEQFIKDGTYGLTAVYGSEDYNTFKFSNDTVLRQMMSFMKPKGSLPKSYFEGFSQACKERVAFYTHYEITKGREMYVMPCEMVSFKTGSNQLSGIILPLQSEYRTFINHHLQRFKTNGVIRRIAQKYNRNDEPPKTVHTPVHLRGIVPILGILIFGFIIASIIFLVERSFYSFRNKLRRRQMRKI
ncbi:glutamate receptor 3 isoform X1 [Diachasma alloeum]|nr:glutamate receptor 3 isoform X1 [Diachasma alloeum]